MNIGTEPIIMRAIIIGKFDKIVLPNVTCFALMRFKFNFLVNSEDLKGFPLQTNSENTSIFSALRIGAQYQ